MEELKLFLEKHPHLQTLQNRLESEMDAVPDEYRMLVVAKHLAWNLEELETELKLLAVLLHNPLP